MKPLGLLFALLVASPAWGQTAWVRVEADQGVVVVDEAPVGAAGVWLAVEAGSRRVALVDDVQMWNPRRADQVVALAPGDSLSLALALPDRVRVETLPIRALVVRERPGGGRDTLGTAPLDIDLAPGERADLVATLDGYDAARTTAGADGTVTLLLMPEPGAVPAAALLPTERSTAARTWIDVGIGVAALAAGAVAVHYKFRADDLDDRYRGADPADRGDESLRQEALRLDRISVVGLGAMQAGLGVLALRFVLR
jgi:hypothetical protein